MSVNDTGSFEDLTLETIRAKLIKDYQVAGTLELLAYHNLQESDFGTPWQPALGSLDDYLDQSLFRRVWVLDPPRKRIEAVLVA